MFIIFFFKQKTAYDMRISDWSSDVCSSDLHEVAAVPGHRAQGRLEQRAADRIVDHVDAAAAGQLLQPVAVAVLGVVHALVGALLAREGELVGADRKSVV